MARESRGLSVGPEGARGRSQDRVSGPREVVGRRRQVELQPTRGTQLRSL